MSNVLEINNVSKIFPNKTEALKDFCLEIKEGEIFALLGPNGAGKTTLISSICGISKPSAGSIKVKGFDTILEYKKARKEIGLVPQELTLESFETVWNTVSFSRGLHGKPANKGYLMSLLDKLALKDKKDQKIIALSGGMKRRVLIAKALSHQPSILFLDEPTAGVDVSLRKTLWSMIRSLKVSGVTVILTTHYIKEAEELADRVGIINRGKLLLVDKKEALMKKLGKQKLIVHIEPIKQLPKELQKLTISFNNENSTLIYTYDNANQEEDLFSIISKISKCGVKILNFETSQSSLEEIFIDLVAEDSL